ncbi:MAG: hypothetical protein GY821_11845 [Gammaproteobacteria bacterium]|nr:hypothetical protein [Gammaproteobacteria bacterium]MCP4475232.1 hypothetical protein [Gammaproteobacteria bacterium]
MIAKRSQYRRQRHHLGCVALLMLLLTACGFRLQTSLPQSLPPQLHVLYFNSNIPYHSLTRQLKNTLQQRLHIKLVCRPEDAPFTLTITNIHESTSAIGSTLSSISTRSYLLTSYLTFTISRADGHPVIAPTTIKASRHFVLPGNVLLNNSDEENIAKEELNQTLIERLFDRLSSNQIRTKLAATPTTNTAITNASGTPHENQPSTT